MNNAWKVFLEEVKSKECHSENVKKITKNEFDLEDIICLYRSQLRQVKKESKYREIILKQSEDNTKYLLWGISKGNEQITQYIYSLLMCIKSKESIVT